MVTEHSEENSEGQMNLSDDDEEDLCRVWDMAMDKVKFFNCHTGSTSLDSPMFCCIFHSVSSFHSDTYKRSYHVTKKKFSFQAKTFAKTKCSQN